MKTSATNRKKIQTVTVGNVQVSIYEHERIASTGKKRTDFLVSDYSTGARRLRWFADRAKAKDEALKIARQLASGETTAARMRNSEAATFSRCIELAKPTGLPLELIVAHFVQAFKILGADEVVEAARFTKQHRTGEVTKKRVAEVVTDLLALMQSKGKSARYVADLKARLTKFSDAFAVDISTISTADVQRWLDGLKVSPQTTKNFRTVLNRLFTFAESRGFIFKGGNPVAGTEIESTKGGGMIEIYTPQEIEALIKHASPDFLPVVALGAFAGLRAAEIERLEWSEIDLAGGFIHVASDKAKTRSRRLVPVAANLAKWLADYGKRKGKVQRLSTALLRDARAECCKAAGVVWKDNGLRHSFVSYRLAEVQDAAKVAMEAGNSADVVFRHYRELVKPSDAVKWFAVAPEQPGNVVSLPQAAKG